MLRSAAKKGQIQKIPGPPILCAPAAPTPAAQALSSLRLIFHRLTKHSELLLKITNFPKVTTANGSTAHGDPALPESRPGCISGAPKLEKNRALEKPIELDTRGG